MSAVTCEAEAGLPLLLLLANENVDGMEQLEERQLTEQEVVPD